MEIRVIRGKLFGPLYDFVQRVVTIDKTWAKMLESILNFRWPLDGHGALPGN